MLYLEVSWVFLSENWHFPLPGAKVISPYDQRGGRQHTGADLLWALHDDSIKAIVCSRGGYGSIHLLNRIPAEDYQRHPKWLIGHGDITMLLNAAVGAGTMCIHGPMAYQIANEQEPATTLTRNMLMLTFNIEGSVETYDTGKEQPQLLKPELVAI